MRPTNVPSVPGFPMLSVTRQFPPFAPDSVLRIYTSLLSSVSPIRRKFDVADLEDQTPESSRKAPSQSRIASLAGSSLMLKVEVEGISGAAAVLPHIPVRVPLKQQSQQVKQHWGLTLQDL